jgi:bacteroidetes-specific putative membrane protein
MTKKIFYSLLLTFGAAFVAQAQQESQYTQYMYNTMLFNPAYTGSRDVPSVFGLFRAQWVGFEGAPTNGNISYHQPLKGKFSNVGLGGSIFHEKIGIEKKTDVTVDFSYTLKFEKSKLAFGISGSANLFDINYGELSLSQPLDPNLTGTENVFSPNLGAGIYWYTNRSYIGFSVPNLLETSHYKDGNVSVLKNTQHLYLIGGYVFNLSPNTKFKPAFLTKMVTGAPLQVDVSANFLFNEKFTLGAAWRWDSAASLMAGFQINERWFIGYAFDYETTPLAKYNSGSHEVFLRFELVQLYKEVLSPRFF